MLKKEKRRLLSMCLVATSLLLCACGGEPQAQGGSGENYRTEFTEEELENGHASFQMEEKIAVDADITPRSSYENGLSSYYLEVISEPGSEDEENFVKNITFSSHSYDEWEKLLNSLQKGRLKDREFKLNRSNYQLKNGKYRGENGRTYTVWAGWSGHGKKYGLDSNFNTAGATLVPPKGENFELDNTILKIEGNFRDYGDYNDLDFLQDPDETAEKIRKFLEDFSGRKIHEQYKFVPAGQKNLERLHELAEKENPFLSELMENDMDKRIGEFIFYYDIDGLPFKDFGLNYFLQGDETACKLCYWNFSSQGTLVAISEHEQEVCVDEKGLLEMDISNYRKPGKVYKEKRTVTEPDKILEQIKTYYGRKLVLENVVITDMELAYTGYFSDASEGEVQPTITPVWVVTVYDEAGKTSRGKTFVYDALTGECRVEEQKGIY